jgi:GxxExxY protein
MSFNCFDICILKTKTMTENDISYKIRGAIFNVYNQLGPGLLESIYNHALMHELVKAKLNVEREVPIPVFYDETKLGLGFRIDLLVEKKVLIEIKSVEIMANVHHKQVLTYLKLTDLRLGILVNFNEAFIEDGIFRKVNNL